MTLRQIMDKIDEEPRYAVYVYALSDGRIKRWGSPTQSLYTQTHGNKGYNSPLDSTTYATPRGLF
jgi:hypothetical protein